MPGPFQTDGIMDEKTYDGWTNYQTRAVALRIDSEQASCQYWRDEARRHRTESPAWRQVRDGIWMADEAAEFNLADQLKKELNDAAPLTEPKVYNDRVLSASVQNVFWAKSASVGGCRGVLGSPARELGSVSLRGSPSAARPDWE